MDIKDLFSESGEIGKGVAPESPLKSLKTDLVLYNDAIKEVADEIAIEGFSVYPIFVAHQHETKLGELILDKNELGTQWTIHASSLEEFIEKGIIDEDKKGFFIQKYKDPADYMCLFVMVPEGANFVFYPYK